MLAPEAPALPPAAPQTMPPQPATLEPEPAPVTMASRRCHHAGNRQKLDCGGDGKARARCRARGVTTTVYRNVLLSPITTISRRPIPRRDPHE